MNTYQNLCTQYYDLDKPTAPPDALNFYLGYVKHAKGPIFEPMCGTGRFLIPILQQGFDIEGSDASQYMLAVCKEKCKAKNLTPKLHHQFLQQMAFKNCFNLIFIPSGSFGLILDVKEAKKSLKILYDHLQFNGKLIFEIETLQSIPKDLGKSHESEIHGNAEEKILLTTVSSYDKENQILQTICNYQLFLNNKKIKTETEDFRVRLYENNEIDAWIKETGFEITARFNDYNRKPSCQDDEIIIYECVKI